MLGIISEKNNVAMKMLEAKEAIFLLMMLEYLEEIIVIWAYRVTGGKADLLLAILLFAMC